ncbi:hypothetical protein F5B21DRAFT_92517 [Xylaria acuta]|nr:hypothetical protein F5B21DRAFT_92517 [Xylaria acuta]
MSHNSVNTISCNVILRLIKLQLSLRGVGESSRTARSLQQDVIPSHWYTVQLRRYHTLCGTVTVTKFSDSMVSNARDCQFAYKVKFEPYSRISRMLVEWRCLIGSTHRAPTLMLSVTTSIICEDPDVIDALGLVTCSDYPRHSSRWDCCHLCHYKTPNLSKVRALVDTGRLLKEHIVYYPSLRARTDVLTAYFECLANFDCSSWGSGELLRYHREFYNVIELLFSRGFEPTLSSWQHIYYQVVRHRRRISQDRPELVRTRDLTDKSISSLILTTCGYSIPVKISAAFEEQVLISPQRLCDVGASRYYAHSIQLHSHTRSSHLGYLIALQFPAEIIRREIPDTDPLGLADENHMLDRWLLGLFAPHRSEIASILQQCLKSYKTAATRKRFEIEYICEEFKQ